MISDASEGGEGETPRRLDQGIFVFFFFKFFFFVCLFFVVLTFVTFQFINA